jgi:hypothetical protein
MEGRVKMRQIILFHRPVRLDHRLVAARERKDIFVAQSLRRVRRERGAKSAAAIQNQFRARVGKHFFQVALQDSLAQMFRLRRVTGVPFVVLAHVNQDGPGILRQPRAGLFDGNFPDARFGVRDQFEKAGRMIHTLKIKRCRTPVASVGLLNGEIPEDSV